MTDSALNRVEHCIVRQPVCTERTVVSVGGALVGRGIYRGKENEAERGSAYPPTKQMFMDRATWVVLNGEIGRSIAELFRFSTYVRLLTMSKAVSSIDVQS